MDAATIIFTLAAGGTHAHENFANELMKFATEYLCNSFSHWVWSVEKTMRMGQARKVPFSSAPARSDDILTKYFCPDTDCYVVRSFLWGSRQVH